MRINEHADSNPPSYEQGHWYKLPEYPEGVYVCPLCQLPETDEVYEFECDCWDEPPTATKEGE